MIEIQHNTVQCTVFSEVADPSRWLERSSCFKQRLHAGRDVDEREVAGRAAFVWPNIACRRKYILLDSVCFIIMAFKDGILILHVACRRAAQKGNNWEKSGSFDQFLSFSSAEYHQDDETALL
jgi:hypothetical protein